MRLYLAIQRDKYTDKDSQEQQAQLVTRMILEFLPEDTLEEFSWCPWRPFSTDNLLLLYRKQRKMKCLEAMDVDRDVLPELKKNEKMSEETFSCARKLALYPENRQTLKLSQFFVQRMADMLEELTVHTNFHERHDPRDRSPNGDDIEPRELNDSATIPGLLSRTIFGHMLPFEECAPFANLTSLRLHRVNLRYCADTWCKFVDFKKIEQLHLHQCSGADALFAQLSKSCNLPRLLCELEFQHRDNSGNEALIALDGFLCLVSGLRYLIVDLEHVKALPAAAGIARHGKTLELLSVHSSPEVSSPSLSPSGEDNEELVWEPDDFDKICQACTGLEQLSCAWPHTSLIRARSEEFSLFERACTRLRDLITLHVSTWPSNKPSTQLLPRNIYVHLLQGLAQRMFGSASYFTPIAPFTTGEPSPIPPSPEHYEKSASKMRLLAFGISDTIFEREDSKNQSIFLRSSCVDAEGRQSVYAAPIGWCLRQYVEPRSDVLDFTLHREARPPCREGRESGGGGGFAWGAAEDDVFDDV